MGGGGVVLPSILTDFLAVLIGEKTASPTVGTILFCTLQTKDIVSPSLLIDTVEPVKKGLHHGNRPVTPIPHFYILKLGLTMICCCFFCCFFCSK